jgi:phenylacetate-CoA ligase
MVPAPRSDPAALKAKVLGNVERHFGTGQTVTFRVLDHIPRSPSGKLKPAVLEDED